MYLDESETTSTKNAQGINHFTLSANKKPYVPRMGNIDRDKVKSNRWLKIAGLKTETEG